MSLQQRLERRAACDSGPLASTAARHGVATHGASTGPGPSHLCIQRVLAGASPQNFVPDDGLSTTHPL